MVSFPAVNLLAGAHGVRVNPHVGPARDEDVILDANRRALHLVPHRALPHRRERHGVEERHALAVRGGDVPTVWGDLDARHGRIGAQRGDDGVGAHVPHADALVVRARAHDQRVLRGELRGANLRRRALHHVRLRVDVAQVVDA